MEDKRSLSSANVETSVISRPSPPRLSNYQSRVQNEEAISTPSEVPPSIDSKESPYGLMNLFDQSTTTGFDDTIHYLSPASPLSPKSAYEGDIHYETPSFMKFLHEIGRVQEYSDISSSNISCIKPKLQRTLAVVKPEAMQYKDAILRAIGKAGFSIIASRTVHFTPEQVSEIYSKHYGSPSYPHMVVSMSIDPVLTLSLAAEDAVSKWKELIGPENAMHAEWFYPMSVRVRFGLHAPIMNALHASENYTDANKENRYVYPESILEPLVSTEDKVVDYCGLYVNPTLLKGLTEVVKVKPVDPILYLAEWLLLNNPFQPRFAPDISVLPT